MRLKKPASPLNGDKLVLTPLSSDDAEDIAEDCDLDGFHAIDETLEIEASQIDPCQLLGLWLGKRASMWDANFDVPDTMIHACFGVHRETPLGRVVGMVGFNRPHGWTNRINVCYWTRRDERGQGLAPRAVTIALPWALETFGVAEAFINATSEASDRVAEKAGFTRMSQAILNSWIYKRLDA